MPPRPLSAAIHLTPALLRLDLPSLAGRTPLQRLQMGDDLRRFAPAQAGGEVEARVRAARAADGRGAGMVFA